MTQKDISMKNYVRKIDAKVDAIIFIWKGVERILARRSRLEGR